MTTADKVATAQAAFDAATAAHKAADRAAKDAYAALNAARIEHGAANPHPLAGKDVKRSATRAGGYASFVSLKPRPDRVVTERGTVVMYGERQLLRNYSPQAGEWFVVSKSGQTAYRLTAEWELDA